MPRVNNGHAILNKNISKQIIVCGIWAGTRRHQVGYAPAADSPSDASPIMMTESLHYLYREATFQSGRGFNS
jgi:hypothetical protein